jgi:hypothetical protein
MPWIAKRLAGISRFLRIFPESSYRTAERSPCACESYANRSLEGIPEAAKKRLV